MKTYPILAILLLLLVSCSDSNPKEENEIVGTWELHRTIMTCTQNGQQQPDEELETNQFGCIFLNGESQYCLSLILNNDGSGQMTSGKFTEKITEEITYRLIEENNTIEICTDVNSCSNYSYANDEILLSDAVGNCVFSFYLKE